MKPGPRPRQTANVCITESDSFFQTARRVAKSKGFGSLPKLMSYLINHTYLNRFYKLDISKGALLPVIPDATHRYSVRIALPLPQAAQLAELAAHYRVPVTKIFKALVAGAINPVNP